MTESPARVIPISFGHTTPPASRGGWNTPAAHSGSGMPLAVETPTSLVGGSSAPSSTASGPAAVPLTAGALPSMVPLPEPCLPPHTAIPQPGGTSVPVSVHPLPAAVTQPPASARGWLGAVESASISSVPDRRLPEAAAVVVTGIAAIKSVVAVLRLRAARDNAAAEARARPPLPRVEVECRADGVPTSALKLPDRVSTRSPLDRAGGGDHDSPCEEAATATATGFATETPCAAHPSLASCGKAAAAAPVGGEHDDAFEDVALWGDVASPVAPPLSAAEDCRTLNASAHADVARHASRANVAAATQARLHVPPRAVGGATTQAVHRRSCPPATPVTVSGTAAATTVGAAAGAADQWADDDDVETVAPLGKASAGDTGWMVV